MKSILSLIFIGLTVNSYSQTSDYSKLQGVIYCNGPAIGTSIYIVDRWKMPKDFERRTVDSLFMIRLALNSLSKDKASPIDLDRIKNYRIESFDDQTFKSLDKRASKQCLKILNHRDKIIALTDSTGRYSLMAKAGGYYILLITKCNSSLSINEVGSAYLSFVFISSDNESRFNFTFPTP